MPEEPRRRLAAVAAAWKDRQRVTLAHIARYGGLAVNTVRYVLDGTTRHPSERTLAGLARGLATDASPPHARDPQDEADCLRDLRAAGGYVTLDEIDAGTLLELGLFVLLRNRRKVAAWMATLRRLEAATPDEVAALEVPRPAPC